MTEENVFELDTELLRVYLFGGIVDDIGTLREPLDIFDFEASDALADGLVKKDQIRDKIEDALGAADSFVYYDENYNIDEIEIPDEQIDMLTEIFFDQVIENNNETNYIELTDLEGRSDPINQTSEIDIITDTRNELDEDEQGGDSDYESAA